MATLSQPSVHRDALESLAQAFKCPKCRAEGGQARRMRIASAEISKFFQRPPGRYALVTCPLCGYSEIYDLAVYASQAELAKVSAAPASQA